jgi:hypothetical protein
VAAARVEVVTLMTKPPADRDRLWPCPLAVRNRIPMFEQVALPQHPRLRAVPNRLERHCRPALAHALIVLEDAHNPKLQCWLFRFKCTKFTKFTPSDFRFTRLRGLLWFCRGFACPRWRVVRAHAQSAALAVQRAVELQCVAAKQHVDPRAGNSAEQK